MEDTLALGPRYHERGHLPVLILVVMEDTLALMGQVKSFGARFKS